jgi:hypothetical protein
MYVHVDVPALSSTRVWSLTHSIPQPREQADWYVYEKKNHCLGAPFGIRAGWPGGGLRGPYGFGPRVDRLWGGAGRQQEGCERVRQSPETLPLRVRRHRGVPLL